MGRLKWVAIGSHRLVHDHYVDGGRGENVEENNGGHQFGQVNFTPSTPKVTTGNYWTMPSCTITRVVGNGCALGRKRGRFSSDGFVEQGTQVRTPVAKASSIQTPLAQGGSTWPSRIRSRRGWKEGICHVMKWPKDGPKQIFNKKKLEN